ncbi:alpha-2-macroglobulin-like protein 1 [Carettochelys insculpta]|uniref:alpha-2-macroglobulin-like protein 1 n=1 Tax=Carettochelys insculpta TaxID=44489 RepID=UPI003EB90068
MEGVFLLWALALLPFAAPATLTPYYMVVFPAIIHSPGHEKICTHLTSFPETVHLSITLEMKTQNHTLVNKDVEKPGIFECISFKVPAFVPEETQFHRLADEVASVHAVIRSGESVSYEGRKKVLIRKQIERVIIDTDKPFYKPGETVKFRIVSLDEDFKAIDKMYPLVLLQDPRGNRISQWVNVKPRQGIVDLSFALASEAALGKYTIKVDEDLLKEAETTFSVEEYELPKFELRFNVPPLVTTSEKEFQFTVCGRYTYGKPVQGKIQVNLAQAPMFFNEQEEENITLPMITVAYENQTDEEGCATFTVDMDDIEVNNTAYTPLLVITAELEEEGTGATNMGTASIFIVAKIVKVNFVNLNPFYKLGFPYTGKMRFTLNSIPIQNHTVYLTVDVDDVETHLPYITDEKGEAHFALDTAKWNNTLVSLRGRYSIVNITQGDLYTVAIVEEEAFNWLKPFYSESNSFLEIQQVEEELPCDQEQEVWVDYILDRNELGPGADHVDFYYLVVSRGRIVLNGQKQVPTGQDEPLKGSFSLTLPISSDLAPSANLLLYAIFADGEVAADVDVFMISKCFKHKVTLDFSEKEDLPGSKVSLNLKADPGSLCSVRAVDKSVRLKDDSLMTPESVYRSHYGQDYMIDGRGFAYRLEDFEPYPCLPPVTPHLPGARKRRSLMGAPWYQSEADVYSLFKQLRMKILTNTKVKKPVSCVRPTSEKIMLFSTRTQYDDNVIPLPVPQPIASAAPSPEKEKTKPRTHFPETWIWDLVPVGEEGTTSLQATAPDTITEWQANMFCVADSGFGLSQTTKFRVFQPFFVDVTLPYSVVREETFTLKATVFNYLKDCIQVHTSLAESPELQVEPCSGCQYTSCLCSSEAKTFSWNVTATKLGKVNVSVSTEAQETHELCGNQIAVTPPRGQTDTVIRTLRVKAGGVLKEETHNIFLCATEDPVTQEVSLKLPEVVLEGSGRASVSVIGDIMGTALHNLHQLLRLPIGCGEQNMVMFAPNTFVLKYLENTNQLTPAIRDKAAEFMKTGYQRQLLYKHDNGSYSAFGKRDAEGNTWLTAFVARSFGQASSYIYIDKQHVQDAIHWLGQNQLPSGCFQSVGKLFNNALKGGVDDEISLTAYITAALLELHAEKNGSLVDDALLCLKKASHNVNSTYAQALMAYVFTLAKDMETRQQLLEKIDQEASKSGGYLYLAGHEISSEKERESSLAAVETAAYVLLAHISKPHVSAAETASASQIVRWLTSQRNAYGGFASTQDTVIGLQALARYAALTYREAEGVKVTVKHKQGSQLEFHVDKKNQLVLQQASLRQVPGEYVVQAIGNGCVYVQTTLRYNIPPPESKATFLLDVKTVPEECSQDARKRFDLHVQVSYVGNRETSNMALIEVKMLSGFIPIKKSVKKLEKIPVVKKTEIQPDQVNIYVEELDKSPLSFIISVKQETEVQNLKPATVMVYDYYQPGDGAITEYNTPCSSGWSHISGSAKKLCPNTTLARSCSQGGVDDEVTLSAYITIALLEIALPITHPVVRNALFCLETATEQGGHHVYTRALLAYVFALAGKEGKRRALLDSLDKDAVKEDSSIHWQRPGKQPEVDLPFYRPRAPSAEVEMTSYVLLAYLTTHPALCQSDLPAAAQIAKWIIKQWNPSGGFSFTQDTVVALQALSLSLYGACTYAKSGGASTVTLQSTSKFQAQFQVDHTNRILLQCVALPEVPGDYSMEVTREGCVYVQDRFCVCLLQSLGTIPILEEIPKLIVNSEQHYPELLLCRGAGLTVQSLKSALVKVYDYYETGEFAIAEYSTPCSKALTPHDTVQLSPRGAHKRPAAESPARGRPLPMRAERRWAGIEVTAPRCLSVRGSRPVVSPAPTRQSRGTDTRARR